MTLTTDTARESDISLWTDLLTRDADGAANDGLTSPAALRVELVKFAYVAVIMKSYDNIVNSSNRRTRVRGGVITSWILILVLPVPKP